MYLSQAGIADLFEQHFNTANVRTYKVAPSAYHMVAEQMDVPTSACCMITAHHWDALGAQFVGYSSGLMHRPGQASLPMRGLPQPLAVARICRVWRLNSLRFGGNSRAAQ